MPTYPAYKLKPYYDALKTWLLESHNEDGTLKSSAVQAIIATDPTVAAKADQSDIDAAIEGIPAVVTFVFDGQGNDVEAGEVARLVMPYSATITGWRVIGSSAGTFSATLRRATFAAFPTMTTISGSDPPALAGTQKAEDTALTGWTTALAMGDVVELLVTEATVPWVSVQIIMTRS